MAELTPQKPGANITGRDVHTGTPAPLRVLSQFAGIGGFDLRPRWAGGFETIPELIGRAIQDARDGR